MSEPLIHRSLKFFKEFKNEASLRKIFTGLKYPNFKLWFFSQTISLFGLWMQITAQGFLIYELTHSSLYLGYIGFVGGIPTWIFTMYGGILADRISKRIILITTQIVSMVLAFILMFLTFANLIEPWHLLILAFCSGVVNAFDAPARHAFVIEMVEKEDLSNAIALNATMFHSATALGPAVGGIIYYLFGPAWCFFVNGISFLGVIVALAIMKLENQKIIERKTSAFADFKEGINFVVKDLTIRTIMLIVMATSILGVSFVTLFPAWAVKILHGDAAINGFIQSARGVGALCGALLIASLGRFKFKGKLLTMGTIILPIFIIIFSLLNIFSLSVVILFIIGVATIIIFNLANSLIQHLVPNILRGRVMGIYSLTFFGFMPIGALLVGFSAKYLGEQLSVAFLGIIFLIISVIVLLINPKIRTLE